MVKFVPFLFYLFIYFDFVPEKHTKLQENEKEEKGLGMLCMCI